METDKNIMPSLNLFPKIKKVAEFLGGLLTPFHEPPDLYMSNHTHVDEMLMQENVAGAIAPDEVDGWN